MVPLINFPLQSVVDGTISYLQFIFANTEIVPPSYRWSDDDRASKIRISAPFVIDNEKPMSAPFIVVERGGFTFAQQVIDNVKSATPNTMETVEKVDIVNGSISVICGAGVAPEATNIANFLAINFQADRHGIAGNMPFVRNFNVHDVGPEMPVFKDNEVKRWEVTLNIAVSLQMGWINLLRQPEPWNKIAFYGTAKETETFSNTGIVVEGEDTLTDSSKQFGLLTGDDPQLLAKELAEGYYYIQLTGSEYPKQLYPVAEIIDANTLRLSTHDTDNNPIPYSAPASETDIEYELWWNSIHIRGEIPNNNS